MIDRIPAYSNKAMWEYCEMLKGVVLQTKTTKSGRGKAVEIREVLKYNTDKKLIEKIVRSCEYYKNLYKMKSKKVGSLEVNKYKFDYVNGEPKIIIEMVKVLDEDGNYIKFAKLEKVIGFLPNYPITFKNLKNE